MRGIGGQLVDHGALGRLVGDEPGLEARLVEEVGQAAPTVEFVVLAGADRREEERHALVRGIALRQDITKYHQIFDPRQLGVGLAAVAVELPVHRARRLADHVDVDFAPSGLGRAPGPEREARRALLEVLHAAELGGAQPHVVHDVDRKDLVAQYVPVARRAPGGPQRQPPEREEDRTQESEVHARRTRDAAAVSDFARREPQQRHVDDADHDDGRVDVAQQLARLARIGRQHVGEHVGGDDRVAEQVEQRELERPEEDERKAEPDHDARAPQQHAPHHVETQRHEDERLDRPHGVVLRVGQHAVGNDERDEEIDRQQQGAPAAAAHDGFAVT